MSKAAPAIPFFGDAYIADTRHLSLEEHGAYLQLLMIAWRADDCALPDDDKRLAQMLGISAARWGKLKGTVMAFWTVTEGRWIQKRLQKERKFVSEKRAVQAERAKAKWGGSDDDARDARRTRAQRLSDARAKGRHNEAQWESLLDATGRICVKCHDAGPLVKDHIVPIYQGGSDAISNIQPLCVGCNSSKGADRKDYRLSVCKDLFERLPECLPKRLPDGAETPAPPPPPPPTEEEETPQAPKGDGKTALPVDWVVPPVTDLPPQAAACAVLWTDESYARHGEAFVSYWRSSRKKMGDWRLTWANRIVSLHAQVIREQTFAAPRAGATGEPQNFLEFKIAQRRAIEAAQGGNRP